MKNKIYTFSVTLLLLTGLSLVSSPHASAFSLNDIINGIKGIIASPSQNQNQKPSLSVTSEIGLAPGGDYNKNGRITSGDIVRFRYTILNTTGNSYTGATLKTNLNTKNLNGINNIQGAVSIDENNNTIIVPNININKDQIRTISFDAQIDFNKDSDQSISIQPVLVGQDGKVLAEDSKKSSIANKMDESTFNKFVHITK